MIAVQRVYGGLIALCGFAFFVWARMWPDAMAVETYGYAAYDTDAEIWAFAYVAAGLLVMLGGAVDRVWRHAALPRAGGTAQLFVMSILLALSSWNAPHGAPVVIFSALFFGPVAAILFGINVRSLRAGMRDGGG